MPARIPPGVGATPGWEASISPSARSSAAIWVRSNLRRSTASSPVPVCGSEETYSAAATSRGSTPVSSASRAALAAIVPTAEERCGIAVTNVPLPWWLAISPSSSRRW